MWVPDAEDVTLQVRIIPATGDLIRQYQAGSAAVESGHGVSCSTAALALLSSVTAQHAVCAPRLLHALPPHPPQGQNPSSQTLCLLSYDLVICAARLLHALPLHPLRGQVPGGALHPRRPAHAQGESGAGQTSCACLCLLFMWLGCSVHVCWPGCARLLRQPAGSPNQQALPSTTACVCWLVTRPCSAPTTLQVLAGQADRGATTSLIELDPATLADSRRAGLGSWCSLAWLACVKLLVLVAIAHNCTSTSVPAHTLHLAATLSSPSVASLPL